jgi:Family of unknown function (DUF6459)
MLPTVAPAITARLDPAEFDRRHATRAQARAGLPDPRVAAARVALALCEVEAGQRPAALLERVCHHTLYHALAARMRRSGGPAVTNRSLVAVVIQEQVPGLVEGGGAGRPRAPDRRHRAGAGCLPGSLAGHRAAVLIILRAGVGSVPLPPWHLARPCPQPTQSSG